MRLFAIAALTVATFVTTMLVGCTQASAVAVPVVYIGQAVSGPMGLSSCTVTLTTDTAISGHLTSDQRESQAV